MPLLIEPVCFSFRLEALPHPSSRSHPTRSSVEEEPLHDARLPGQPPEWSAKKRSPLPRVLRGVRVLVVDDDAETVELFAAALTACGAEVITAISAPEALRLLEAQPPNVVVSDIAMPGADGYWLVREIRRLADPRVSSMPVVAVTAYGREHFRRRTLAAGFVDHLDKPIDPEDLCRAVAKAAGRP